MSEGTKKMQVVITDRPLICVWMDVEDFEVGIDVSRVDDQRIKLDQVRLPFECIREIGRALIAIADEHKA